MENISESNKKMKIVLWGATGLTGKEVLPQALDKGLQVKAIVRKLELIRISHNNLTVINDDILNKQSVIENIADCDVVISTVRTTSFSKAGKPTKLYSEGFKTLLLPCANTK
ncbi:MAG: hypothetical protein B6I20_05905 [Bacteroidetes bacterium 4572_117]|nr:MAG: hypothetical protein B6I20_05905 [Bacteroidetes bacterium 4572_117]